ncbi:MAG: hypothetical protein KAJ91_02325 [Candidatus Aenigmarchaeota archaeon]|nr:hypothetical protein [Candidatus Aenigmarchaeota archaeon]
MRYIESLEAGQKIGWTVLVAGFSDILEHKELDSFFEMPIEWEKIKQNCKKIIAINSDNDYYVPLTHANVLRNKLGAEVIIKHHRRNASCRDGITELPVALESVLKISCINSG